MLGDDIRGDYYFSVPPMSGFKKKTSTTIPQGIIDSVNRLFPGLSGFSFPDLVYSDEEPDRYKRGKYSKDEIGKKLGELADKYKELYPSGCDFIRRYTDGEAKYRLMKDAGKYDGPEWMGDLAGEARKIFEDEEIEMVTFAKYDPADNRITIFKKAFDGIKDANEKEARIRMAIAHEVFHAIHCHLAPVTYHENNYYAEVVREALADFYSYVLCLDPAAAQIDGVDISISEKVAHKRYDFWKEYLFADTPYPNAIFCMYRNGCIAYDGTYDECKKNGSIDRMKKILETSKGSMSDAYFELVPEFFRKDPKDVFRKRERRAGKRFWTLGVGVPDGPVQTYVEYAEWRILKRIVQKYDIGSLEELQDFIPEDIFTVARGRFVTLESGEILSAYPQWKVINESAFFDFAEEKGILETFDEDFQQKIRKLIIRYTLVDVDLGSGKAYKYLFDPEDDLPVNIGETLACRSRRGGSLSGKVVGVSRVTKEQYEEECRKYTNGELSVASRYK